MEGYRPNTKTPVKNVTCQMNGEWTSHPDELCEGTCSTLTSQHCLDKYFLNVNFG